MTLHYFALDSADWWERILGELLPNARFPDAVVRRTVAAKMFTAVHIAPSHRRPPHPVWVDSFSLIADRLFGNGVDRYVGAMQGPAFPQEVAVRGFSAGSFSGLAFLHILRPIPRVTTKGCLGAIACPPSLLGMSQAKAEDQLHLIHYEGDGLCCLKPGLSQLQQSSTSYTYVTNEIASYKGHFGPSEHDYSHWLALDLPPGRIALRILLFIRPEAASKAKRDATPLRLISWLSYKLNPELELFIEEAMEHLSTWEESEGGKVLTMGRKAIQQGEAINTETELRDRLISVQGGGGAFKGGGRSRGGGAFKGGSVGGGERSRKGSVQRGGSVQGGGGAFKGGGRSGGIGNLRHKPEALFALFRQFLRRISLPRLIHFFDLVLPHLMPVQAAWAGEEKTLWSCHHIRHLCTQQYANRTPSVQISYFFTSHDHVHHVRIQWNGHIPSCCSLIH